MGTSADITTPVDAQMHDKALPVFLSIEETRRQLGDMSRAAIYRLLREKRLAAAKVGRRRLILASLVRELAEQAARGGA